MLDLSDRRDLDKLAEVVSDLRAAAPEARPLLVGATARDVLLRHAHGIRTRRATEDIDLAIMTADWAAFQALRQSMIASPNFQPVGRIQHKFRHRGGSLPVDLIPFGGVQQSDGRIAWPPAGDEVMAVLGYRAALETSLDVMLPGRVLLNVISLPMLAALKTMAWSDRHWEAPRKDASDLILILQNYLETGQRERIYTEAAHLLEAEDFDLDRASAWLTGYDAARMIHVHRDESDHLMRLLMELLDRESDPDGALRLVGQVDALDAEATRRLLVAFRAGLEAGAIQ
jgi:predicted nucleotidyltransferase